MLPHQQFIYNKKVLNKVDKSSKNTSNKMSFILDNHKLALSR